MSQHPDDMLSISIPLSAFHRATLVRSEIAPFVQVLQQSPTSDEPTKSHQDVMDITDHNSTASLSEADILPSISPPCSLICNNISAKAEISTTDVTMSQSLDGSMDEPMNQQEPALEQKMSVVDAMNAWKEKWNSITQEEADRLERIENYKKAHVCMSLAVSILHQLPKPIQGDVKGQTMNVLISLKPPPPYEKIKTNIKEEGCQIFVQFRSQEGNNQNKIDPGVLNQLCSLETVVALVRQKLSLGVSTAAQKKLQVRRGIYGVILYAEDSKFEIHDARVAYNLKPQQQPQQQPPYSCPCDVIWWDDAYLSQLMLLRRLASGLDFFLVPRGVSLDDSSGLWPASGARIFQAKFSLLQVFLQIAEIKEESIAAVFKRLVLLQQDISKLATSPRRWCLQLQRHLVSILNKAAGSFQLPNDSELELAKLRLHHLPEICALYDSRHFYFDGLPKFALEARWYLEPEQDENRRIREERSRLLMNFAEKQKKRNLSNRRSLQRANREDGRMHDGAVLYTSDKMTFEEFTKRSTFMQKVNSTLLRHFFPRVSRPSCKQLNLSLNSIQELKQLFFDNEGRLHRDVVPDIDMGTKHGFISFENLACLEERSDKRWQVPIRRHSPVIGPVPSRSTVESILQKEGVIDRRFEVIHDLGLLLGGTQDQCIHHDIARQTTCWLPRLPTVEAVVQALQPVPGWEIDRLEYNQAMSNPFAPCSMLMGLGDSDVIHIGIQSNQVTRYGLDENWCEIHNGEPDEKLEIIRENYYLVVVRAHGFAFTGDFPHAGVKNFPPGSAEETLMMELELKIDETLMKYSQDHMAGTKAVVEVLRNFRGLNKLCRLHCSTELLDSSMSIPRNTIGFSGCFANPPDDRCFEDDGCFEDDWCVFHDEEHCMQHYMPN